MSEELLSMVPSHVSQRSNARGDVVELSLFPGLPLGASNNRHLSLASATGHKSLSIGSVHKVGLLPGKELLGVVYSLGGQRSNAGSDVSQLGVLVSLPLGGSNNLDLGRGEGQAG